MTYIVTGAAGFIGANIIRALNERGIQNIIAVDDLEEGNKFINLSAYDIAHYMDKHDFLNAVLNHDLDHLEIKAVFHEGACSDTMNHDGLYMMQNNYQYTLDLFDWCQDKRIPFLYASSAAVYGRGEIFVEDRSNEGPLNVYGYSKFLFDQVLRQRMQKGLKSQAVGFRYFNVYGYHEQHKGRMASVVYHHFNQYQSRAYVELFGAHDDYANGMQSRDFVSVEDVVKVNLFFLDHPEKSGIFNLGTGRSQSFNELSVATINACRHRQGLNILSLDELVKNESIRYILFPDSLKGKYQSFTQANIDALRNAGYQDAFLTIEQGVSRYVEKLLKDN